MTLAGGGTVITPPPGPMTRHRGSGARKVNGSLRKHRTIPPRPRGLERRAPRGVAARRWRFGLDAAQIVLHPPAVIDEDHVAPGDADVVDRRAAVLRVERRQAEREGQGVLRHPLDLVERRGRVRVRLPLQRIGDALDADQPDRMTVRRVGVLGPAGLGAEHLLEDQHVAGGEQRLASGDGRRQREGRAGRAARQATLLATPRVERDPAERLADNDGVGIAQRRRHREEDLVGRRRAQELVVADEVRPARDARVERDVFGRPRDVVGAAHDTVTQARALAPSCIA
jgi:hypothetical protein